MTKQLKTLSSESARVSGVLCPRSPTPFQRRLPLLHGPNLDCDGCMQVIQTVAELSGKTHHSGF